MRISELMTPDVEVVTPDDSLHTAARIMADLDTGAVPVGEDHRLVGVITDRDITVRAVAEGLDPDQTPVRDIMSRKVHYCFDDESSADVARNMGNWQVRRLPVLNREKQLVGIISLGDLAIAGAARESGRALEKISRG